MICCYSSVIIFSLCSLSLHSTFPRSFSLHSVSLLNSNSLLLICNSFLFNSISSCVISFSISHFFSKYAIALHHLFLFYHHGQKCKTPFWSTTSTTKILNPVALPILFSLGHVRSAFHADSKFRCFFINFAPFCYDVTLKSIEIHDSFNGSTEKGYDPKNVLLGWILHQSMHKSCL